MAMIVEDVPKNEPTGSFHEIAANNSNSCEAKGGTWARIFCHFDIWYSMRDEPFTVVYRSIDSY